MKTLRLVIVTGLLAAIGAIAGFASSFGVTPVYVSSFRMFLRLDPAQSAVSHQILRERVATLTETVTSRDSLSILMQQPRLNLYPQERLRGGFADALRQMKDSIQVEIAGFGENSIFFDVAVRYRDKYKAQVLATAIMSEIRNQKPGDSKLEAIDYANLPIEPERPVREGFGWVGAAVGLVLGWGIGYCR